MFGAANGMLKEGARHYSGLEEALFRNIDAVQQLAQMTRSALGPHGKFCDTFDYMVFDMR